MVNCAGEIRRIGLCGCSGDATASLSTERLQGAVDVAILVFRRWPMWSRDEQPNLGLQRMEKWPVGSTNRQNTLLSFRMCV